MNSIKAIIIGGVFIVISLLLLQLLYLFVAVAFNQLMLDYPLLATYSGYLRYLIGIPVLLLIMFYGGYLTAEFAVSKVVLHSSLVGVLLSVGMVAMALQNTELTGLGALLSLLLVLTTAAGGLHWQRQHTGAEMQDSPLTGHDSL